MVKIASGKARQRRLSSMVNGLMSTGVKALAGTLLATALGAAAEPSGVDAGLDDFKQGRFAEALQDWRQAASTDARGALYTGVLYDSGLGVPQDYKQAMAWYRQAADAGSSAGAFNVGVLYDAGLGVTADLPTAAAWYERAAAAGFARADYNLALLYEAGAGVPRSRERAIALFRTAAEQGITAAHAHLVALGQDVSSTVRPLRGPSLGRSKPIDSAMQDFQQAQQLLLNRGPAEAASATALFRRAAEQHNALAEYDLGYCLDRGIGVPRDPAQAYGWYRRAAADTSDDALRSIAQVGASNLEGQIRQAQLPPNSRP